MWTFEPSGRGGILHRDGRPVAALFPAGSSGHVIDTGKEIAAGLNLIAAQDRIDALLEELGKLVAATERIIR